MKAIGGYLELEPANGRKHAYHDTPYALKSGRAAMYHILTTIRPELVYVPYYSCDTLLQPFHDLHVNFVFYQLNDQLEPAVIPDLHAGQYFLYINYNDSKSDHVQMLSDLYRDKLIIDNTQAFYVKGNGVSWSFNSCRKFYGVPDGAYLYAPSDKHVDMPADRNEHYTIRHLELRRQGLVNDGYRFFLENEHMIGEGYGRMSLFTDELLAYIDDESAIARRRENYQCLHNRLNGMNRLNAFVSADAIPMYYPLLPEKYIDRLKLSDKQVFIPSLWKEVSSRSAEGYEWEKTLANEVLPLPIDQRYTIEDMELLYRIIVSL